MSFCAFIPQSSKKDRVWAYLIGAGFVLFAIHNPLQPLKEFIFLPVLGMTISLMGIIVVLQDHRKELSLGNRYIYIPLVVIAASIAGSGLVKLASIPNGEARHIVGFALACVMFGFYLFGVYLTGRVLGEKLFTPFTWAVVIGAVSCIGYGIAFPGSKTGGLISPGNYDIATGLLVFGTLVSVVTRQWWLVAIALVGLFFTGADEAIFACAVVLVVVLARRDWSRKMLLPIGALVLTLVVCTPLGITQELYFPSVQKVATTKEAIEDTAMGKALDKVMPAGITNWLTPKAIASGETTDTDELLDKATGYRWLGHWGLKPIKPFGYGYNMTAFYDGIPHNQILIIIEQVGVLAAVAWLWVSLFSLVKTRWKYAWAGVLALGVFDHYLWTQVAPWWWALAGVSSASSIGKDYIFKEVSNARNAIN